MTVVLAKVAKLIRPLASDKPGEAMAAVHAIRRTLAGAGLDLHDLAHVIETAGEIKTAPEVVPSDETIDWQQFAVRILRHHGAELNEKEATFVGTMSRWRGLPSRKQQEWLCDIAARFAARAA
jgi:hypothetical protein